MKSNMCYVYISHFLAIHWPTTTVSNHYFPFKTRPKYWFYFIFNQGNPKPFFTFLLYNKKYIHCNDIVISKLCPSLRLVLSLKYFCINLSELYLGRCWFYPAEQKRGTTARRSSHVQQERFKNNLNHYNSHAFVFDTSKLLIFFLDQFFSNSADLWVFSSKSSSQLEPF